MRLPTATRARIRAAAAHPRVHSIGNAHPVHAALLPLVWTWIRYAAHAGVDVRARALIELVPREYLTGGSACDLGCSVGHMTRLLKDVGVPRVVGVDASDSMLAVARLASPTLTFLKANACLDPLPAASLYTLSFVLHEMPAESHYAVVRNALRYNHSAGVLVVDIDPSTSAAEKNVDAAGVAQPATGDEPFLVDYCATVEATLHTVARRTGKRVHVASIVPGACRAWFLC